MDRGSGVGSNSKPGRSCSFPDTCHVGPGASGQLTAMKKPIFYILLFFINHSFQYTFEKLQNDCDEPSNATNLNSVSQTEYEKLLKKKN